MQAVRRWCASLSALLAVLGGPSLGWAQAQGVPYHGPGMMWEYGWAPMIFGPLLMIIFIAAVVVLVVLAIRWLGGSGRGGGTGSPPGRTALDILKERYARGEIDTQEFEERRRVLSE